MKNTNEKFRLLCQKCWELESYNSTIVKNVPDKNSSIKHLEFTQSLVNFIDDYPGISQSYGGSLPLSALNQIEIVNIRSSLQWRTSKYALPRKNPSFNKLMKSQMLS
jgi:hypothetical protein